MQPRRLRLKREADPRDTIRALDEAINAGRNVIATAPTGTGIGPGVLPLAAAYVDWLAGVENQLHAVTLDFDVVEALHTSRYWRIRQLHEEPQRPVELVRAEMQQQTGWLEALRTDLQQRVNRIDAASGDPAVLDTNVLLEFVPPQDVDWISVTGRASVRLIVPLRVVEELDVLKYDRRRQDRAERARRILPQLEAAVGTGGAPSELRPETTIEVLIEPTPRHRPTDADEENSRRAVSSSNTEATPSIS